MQIHVHRREIISKTKKIWHHFVVEKPSREIYYQREGQDSLLPNQIHCNANCDT